MHKKSQYQQQLLMYLCVAAVLHRFCKRACGGLQKTLGVKLQLSWMDWQSTYSIAQLEKLLQLTFPGCAALVCILYLHCLESEKLSALCILRL